MHVLDKAQSYLGPGIYGVVHDSHPALEGGHLEEAKVGLTHMIKVHDRVLPQVAVK